VIFLIILVLLFRFIVNTQYRSQIPVISDLSAFSQPVRDQISDALNKAHHKPSAYNIGFLGMVYHSSACYEQAAECYKLAIRKKKSDWIWNYYLGHLNIEMGQPEAVIENFTDVTDKNPAVNLAWYYLGEAYKNKGEIELAEESFGTILSPGVISAESIKTSSNRKSTKKETKRSTGQTNLKSDQKTTAKGKIPVSSGTTRTDYFPLSTYARFQLSRIYNETGRYDLAEKTLKDILKTSHSFGPAYRLLGNIYSAKGDSVFNKQYGNRANDLLPFSPPVDTLIDNLVLLSRSELYVLKKIDEAKNSVYSQWALKLVNNALQYLPDNKYLISKAIEIYLWVDLDSMAINLTDRHTSFFQDNFTELKKTGMMFFLNGLYSQSMKYFIMASGLNPEDAETQENMAISYWYLGDQPKAYEIIDELQSKNRNNADVLADIANILFFNFKESNKAVDYLVKLKQISPSNPKVLKLSAGMAEKKGNFREAITLYESSFSGNPEDIATIQYLGNLLMKEELWDKAIHHYRNALVYHPNEPDFLEWLGSLLIMCPDTSFRNIEDGKYYAERAFYHISSRPNVQVSAGRSLAYAYTILGDKKNAASIINQTINIARRENISRSYQAELENLYNYIQAMND